MSTLKVKLVVTENGNEITYLDEELKLINIPFAWSILRLNSADGEKKGHGQDRKEVIIDWLHKNHGPQQMMMETVPRVIVDSLLGCADNRELSKLFGKTLLKLLQEKFGKDE